MLKCKYRFWGRTHRGINHFIHAVWVICPLQITRLAQNHCNKLGVPNKSVLNAVKQHEKSAPTKRSYIYRKLYAFFSSSFFNDKLYGLVTSLVIQELHALEHSWSFCKRRYIHTYIYICGSKCKNDTSFSLKKCLTIYTLSFRF